MGARGGQVELELGRGRDRRDARRKGARVYVWRERFAMSGAGPKPAKVLAAERSPAAAEVGKVFLDFKINEAIDRNCLTATPR